MSIIEELQAHIRHYESQGAATRAVMPFYNPAIDSRLPDGGLKFGAFHEVASAGDCVTHGAAAALFAAGILARTIGPILWCVRQKDLFAPALTQVGLSIDRIIFVECRDEKTLLACFEEGLRHGSMTGVVAEINKLTMTQSRRLQLAAESSGALGIGLWRWQQPSTVKNQIHATAAHTCWRVSVLPSLPGEVPGIGRGRWRVELERCRGGERANFEVEACDETGHIALLSDMVDRPDAEAAGGRRASI